MLEKIKKFISVHRILTLVFFAVVYPIFIALALFKIFDMGPLAYVLLIEASIKKPFLIPVDVFILAIFFGPAIFLFRQKLRKTSKGIIKLVLFCFAYLAVMIPVVVLIDFFVACKLIGPCEVP